MPLRARKPQIDPSDLDIRPIPAGCNVGTFSCGYTKIDGYFQHQCGSDHINYESRSVVAFRRGVAHPVGFYTFCVREEPSSLFASTQNFASRFFKPEKIIVAHIKWAGVDTKHQGEGIGRLMLGNALDDFYEIATRSGIFVLTFDAISDRAMAFYKRLGFQNTEGYTHKLHLPIADLIASRNKIESA